MLIWGTTTWGACDSPHFEGNKIGRQNYVKISDNHEMVLLMLSCTSWTFNISYLGGVWLGLLLPFWTLAYKHKKKNLIRLILSGYCCLLQTGGGNILFLSPDYSSLMRMLKKTIRTQMTMMLIQHQNEKVKVVMLCLLKSVP